MEKDPKIVIKSKLAQVEHDIKYHKDKIEELRFEWDVWTDRLELETENDKVENGGEIGRNINPEHD